MKNKHGYREQAVYNYSEKEAKRTKGQDGPKGREKESKG